MEQTEIKIEEQNELRNLKKFLKDSGCSDEKLKLIATGEFSKNKKKKIDRCVVTLEIFIDKDIAKKYPNFILNYENEKHFLISQVANLNQYITIDECKVFLNLHPQFENPDFEIEDFGFKQIVKKVDFL